MSDIKTKLAAERVNILSVQYLPPVPGLRRSTFNAVLIGYEFYLGRGASRGRWVKSYYEGAEGCLEAALKGVLSEVAAVREALGGE